ncbi:MAG: hypothetical protein K0R43_2121 [Pseudoduganella sp.]|jgi:hypothetical protein|nr:hypothetical protein [Pseudoduganella sp.]
MSDAVPFDPPYVKKTTSQEGERWVAVNHDGTEMPCEAPATWAPASAKTASASPSPKKSRGTVLNVPYAEKDEAKSLGAKWDATRKKWYVPDGVNAEPFSRWA